VLQRAHLRHLWSIDTSFYIYNLEGKENVYHQDGNWCEYGNIQ